jgi:hypothetical protein
MVLLNESGAEVKHPGDSTLHIHMALYISQNELGHFRKSKVPIFLN